MKGSDAMVLFTATDASRSEKKSEKSKGPMGCCVGGALAIGGRIAPVMAIMESTLMSDHQNYVRPLTLFTHNFVPHLV